MARDHARVYCAIWGDPDWRALPPTAQRLYLLALSQRDISHAGVVAFTPARWAALAANTSTASIRRDARLLEERDYVVLDEATEELLIRTFIRHDRVLVVPNVAIAMARAARLIVSPKIRRAFYEVLVQLRDDDDPVTPMNGWKAAEVAGLLIEARSDVG
jgi:hypothetical protein